ncbi:MAG TPA: phosphopantetheine-binding protein [Mycobacteriales bacterium]|nr:phosphopantetheine-binding protein [Mycobacteriales bacterium]
MTTPRVPEAEVERVILAAIVKVMETDPARLNRTTALVRDLNADSLALVEIVDIVEEGLAPRARPGFHIDDDDLDGLVTVGDAISYVLARL